ncbi:MAG TPA: PASTA domain-containing protein [Longimicrobium sp.]|nr:PASTA domain-containing protein [Longimicrobium sp.]
MPTHPSPRRSVASFLALALVLVPAALAADAPAARTGPALVVVPDVRGQTLYGAAAQMAVAGLVPRHAASAPGNVDTSPVRRQWPSAGQRVPEGTVVALELGAMVAPTVASAPLAPPAAPRLARASVKASFDAPVPGEQKSAALAWWLAAAMGVTMLALACRQAPAVARAFDPTRVPAEEISAALPASAAPVPAEARAPAWNGVQGTTIRGAPAFAVVAAGAIAAAPATEA